MPRETGRNFSLQNGSETYFIPRCWILNLPPQATTHFLTNKDKRQVLMGKKDKREAVR